MISTIVVRVLIDIVGTTPRAMSVDLADSRRNSATKEVVISTGAYRTPQILLPSEIGPLEELAKHGIE